MPSTIQLYSQTITDFKKLQDSLYSAQSKIGANSKAETFAELGSEVSVVQSFSFSAQRANRYSTSIAEVSRRLDTSYRAVDDIIESAIDFKKSLTLENSPNSNVNDLTSQANTALDLIRGALNSRDGAIYVFAGSKTNEEPVEDLKQTSNYVDGKATANYYNGDDFKASVDVSRSLNVEYGVAASDPAFQNLIASLNLSKEYEKSGSGLEEAGKLLESAIDDLITLRAKMGNNTKVLEQNANIQSKAETTFKQKLAEVNEPDIVSLTILTNQNQAALTALFQNFSRISNLSLVNFLK
jgi:flagellar hook-associated protein 3 FlgL